MNDLIYKICHSSQWSEAEKAGVFEGALVDLLDGFIHFSSAEQVEETASKHFAGKRDLVLAAIDPARLGNTLKFEPSRGGDLFPHLYGSLPMSAVIWSEILPLDDNDVHVFPNLRTGSFE